MRAYKRSEVVHGELDQAVLKQVGLTAAQVEDMYQTMAIANYEDRFVIPSSHKEMVEDSFNEKGSCGFHVWQWLLRWHLRWFFVW